MRGQNVARPLLLAFCFVLIPVFVWLLLGTGPTKYLLYYLPCPEIFSMKLQYREEKLPRPFPPLSYPQPDALEQSRSDVLTLTPWLAPIIWDGTFDSRILDQMYKPLNLTIGVTVFAVGKYIQFVGRFLDSAERHFMAGYRVNYYVFTDRPRDLPGVRPQPGRTLTVVPVKGYARWEEISTRRMEAIHRHISQAAHREVDYLFCLDVDMVFRRPWGAEALGAMVAALHPGYYKVPRDDFPYERRRLSAAYVPRGEGDFYYAGAVFGGLVGNVYEFTGACHAGVLADKANGLMAAWQEESHLNRRFLTHKPSKLLSPEYIWDDDKAQPPEVRLVRFSTVQKNYRQLRS